MEQPTIGASAGQPPHIPISLHPEDMVTPLEDSGGVHGNNERVTEENVRRGTRLMFEITRRFVSGRTAMP